MESGDRKTKLWNLTMHLLDIGDKISEYPCSLDHILDVKEEMMEEFEKIEDVESYIKCIVNYDVISMKKKYNGMLVRDYVKLKY